MAWTVLRRCVLPIAALMPALYVTLTLMVVPAPGPGTAVEVSGRPVHLGRPHPENRDMAVTLDGGRLFYMNRADTAAGFAWERLLKEVRPGDELYLTAVHPLAWRLTEGLSAPARGPVAGVRTDTTTYLDAGVAARTWGAQREYQRMTFFALALVYLCVLPDLARWGRGRGRQPAARSAA